LYFVVPYSATVRYEPCTGDPRSANSLTSPVSTLENNTAMSLSVQFLSAAATTIQVYQSGLGNVDVLLATFNYPPTMPVNYTGNTSTTHSESTFYAVFDVCLPAGTYSVIFLANAVCSTTTCSRPSVNFLDFSANEHSGVCSTAVNNSSAGSKQLHVNCLNGVKRRDICTPPRGIYPPTSTAYPQPKFFKYPLTGISWVF
jgi:hypothetical protein